jgi:hypothetical protein
VSGFNYFCFHLFHHQCGKNLAPPFFIVFFSMGLMTAFAGRLAIWCASKFGWAMHVYGFSSASIDFKPLYTLCWRVYVKISFYQVPSDVFLAGNCTRSKEQPTHVGIYF